MNAAPTDKTLGPHLSGTLYSRNITSETLKGLTGGRVRRQTEVEELRAARQEHTQAKFREKG